MGMSRSENMRRIRSRGTIPERTLGRLLWAKGVRYRKQVRCERVLTDFAVVARKLAVFVDGCFWHGCATHRVVPRANAAFWQEKLAANVRRDARQRRRLRDLGWTVFRIWEHELETRPKALERKVNAIVAAAQARPPQ